MCVHGCRMELQGSGIRGSRARHGGREMETHLVTEMASQKKLNACYSAGRRKNIPSRGHPAGLRRLRESGRKQWKNEDADERRLPKGRKKTKRARPSEEKREKKNPQRKS